MLVDGNRLQRTSAATTVRANGGKTNVLRPAYSSYASSAVSSSQSTRFAISKPNLKKTINS